MSYSSEIISPQKCFLKVSCFHCVLNPHGIIFSFTKSRALRKIIIKTGVSQWDSPTFVWLLLKEHYNTHSLFEQSGEMPVSARSGVSPETPESGEGKMWILGMRVRPFYSILCLRGQKFSLSLSHAVCVLAPLPEEVLSHDERAGASRARIRCLLCPDSVHAPADDFTCLSFSNYNECRLKTRA